MKSVRDWTLSRETMRPTRSVLETALLWRDMRNKGLANTNLELAKLVGTNRATANKMLAIADLPGPVLDIIKQSPQAFGLHIGYSLALYCKQFGQDRTIEFASEIAREAMPHARVEAIRKADIEPQQLCHLYLLLNAPKTAIKIGVAADVHSRLLGLGQPIEISKSYVLSGARDACFRAEGVMHTLLWRYRLPATACSGGSEWFDASCAPRALEILQQLAADMELSEPAPCETKLARVSQIRRRGMVATIKEWGTGRITMDLMIEDASKREALVASFKAQLGVDDGV